MARRHRVAARIVQAMKRPARVALNGAIVVMWFPVLGFVLLNLLLRSGTEDDDEGVPEGEMPRRRKDRR